MGKHKEAQALAEGQVSIIASKEMLLPMATSGVDMMRYQGERIMTLLTNLRLSVSEAMAMKDGLSMSPYKEKIFLALLNVYETIFEDGRCGAYHQSIGNMYMHLADYACICKPVLLQNRSVLDCISMEKSCKHVLV